MLCEPKNSESINSRVIHEMNKLLNKWIRQDNDVLKNEYDKFVTDSKNKKENKLEIIKEIETQSCWKIKKTFKQLKKTKTKEAGWIKNKSEQWTNKRPQQERKDIESKFKGMNEKVKKKVSNLEKVKIECWNKEKRPTNKAKGTIGKWMTVDYKEKSKKMKKKVTKD